MDTYMAACGGGRVDVHHLPMKDPYTSQAARRRCGDTGSISGHT